MTQSPAQTFTVGEIIALSTGLALYGAKTFERSKVLGEFRTGLTLELESEPDIDTDDFVTLTGWRLAVLQADEGRMRTQMVAQYPTAMLLGAITVTPPERDDEIPAMVEAFKVEAAHYGIDLEHRVKITPLGQAEMALTRRMYGTQDYQRHCVEAMLWQAAHV